MSMKIPSILPTYRLLVLSIGAAIALASQSAAKGQQLFIDFRFDTNDSTAGRNPTVLGQQSVTITNSAAQTYTVDIWATIVAASQPDTTKYGFNQIHLRGYSD